MKFGLNVDIKYFVNKLQLTDFLKILLPSDKGLYNTIR